MMKEVSWQERLQGLSAAVRIAIKDECRKEQIACLQIGDAAGSESVGRVEQKLLIKFASPE